MTDTNSPALHAEGARDQQLGNVMSMPLTLDLIQGSRFALIFQHRMIDLNQEVM